ncbi:hypothetical protein [Acidovorax phage AP1]|nr:hypothetical protein [Acidovorax phage AP1]
MTDTTTADMPEALQIVPVNNDSGSTMSIARWQIETPAGWVGAYHKAPLEYLLAARAKEAKPAPPEPQGNTGHGHVFPRPDGVKARCGGPGICNQCSIDAARAKEGKA